MAIRTVIAFTALYAVVVSYPTSVSCQDATTGTETCKPQELCIPGSILLSKDKELKMCGRKVLASQRIIDNMHLEFSRDCQARVDAAGDSIETQCGIEMGAEKQRCRADMAECEGKLAVERADSKNKDTEIARLLGKGVQTSPETTPWYSDWRFVAPASLLVGFAAGAWMTMAAN